MDERVNLLRRHHENPIPSMRTIYPRPNDMATSLLGFLIGQSLPSHSPMLAEILDGTPATFGLVLSTSQNAPDFKQFLL